MPSVVAASKNVNDSISSPVEGLIVLKPDGFIATPSDVENDDCASDDVAGAKQLDILVYIFKLDGLDRMFDESLLRECQHLLQITVIGPERAAVGDLAGGIRKQRDVDSGSHQ